MKKIAIYLSCDPAWGGTFQYSLSLLQSLLDLERNNLIQLTVLIENEAWREVLQEENVQNIEVVRNNFFFRGLFKIWNTLKLPIRIWQYIGDHFHPIASKIKILDCEVCFFPSQDSMSYGGTYRSITAIHDLMHRYESQFPEVGNAKEFRFREYHYKNICKFSYKIMVDSEIGKVQVCESYGTKYERKILVVPYIVPDYLDKKNPDYSVYERYQIPEKYFFYPAQFWKHKNHINLIKAFAIVVKQFPDVGLVLTGGKKNGYLEAMNLVANLGLKDKVIFPGYVSVEEIIALYKNAESLVMPTHFGPTNIPPLEALSLGTPVIYSKIYAYKEFLEDDAIFIDPYDIDDISQAMVKILSGNYPRNFIRKKNRSYLSGLLSNIINLE